MTENSLILLYCIVDDFIQRFIETSTGKRKRKLDTSVPSRMAVVITEAIFTGTMPLKWELILRGFKANSKLTGK